MGDDGWRCPVADAYCRKIPCLLPFNGNCNVTLGKLRAASRTCWLASQEDSYHSSHNSKSSIRVKQQHLFMKKHFSGNHNLTSPPSWPTITNSRTLRINHTPRSTPTTAHRSTTTTILPFLPCIQKDLSSPSTIPGEFVA